MGFNCLVYLQKERISETVLGFESQHVNSNLDSHDCLSVVLPPICCRSDHTNCVAVVRSLTRMTETPTWFAVVSGVASDAVTVVHAIVLTTIAVVLARNTLADGDLCHNEFTHLLFAVITIAESFRFRICQNAFICKDLQFLTHVTYCLAITTVCWPFTRIVTRRRNAFLHRKTS